MSRYERILAALKEMDMDEIVSVWDEFCSAAHRMDDYVYTMDEFDEAMDGMTAWKIARCCFYGDFRPCDEYFCFNGYANVESFDWYEEKQSPIDLVAVADYCDENDADLCCAEINSALNEEDEEEA